MTFKVERVWIDLETTGLSENIDYILELAIALTDKYGNIIDARSWLMPPTYRPKQTAVDRAKADSFVGPMHTTSGLWKDLEEASPLVEGTAEGFILDYLVELDLKDPMPMSGSSIHFDRKFIAKYMPQMDMFFHYRNIDVSSIKELCKDLAPKVYARIKEELHPQRLHRGVPDLYDTVEEYRFYLDNFLKVEW